MAYFRIKYESAKAFAEAVFVKLGYADEDAKGIADVILESDLRGIESHGVQRLDLYYKSVLNGRIRVNAQIEVLNETPTFAVLDAHQAAGQLTSIKAMNMAIKKAKAVGFGMAVVKDGNHNGIAGYYATMAQKEGLLGVSMTNAEGIIPPTYGKRALLGTNPISVSISAEPYPYLLDMSTSVVPRGKIEVYSKKKQPMPVGWCIDRNGKDTQDPDELLYDIKNKICGGILPLGGSGEMLGGHKGYGLALLVEIFTGIFAGGFTSNRTYGYEGPGKPQKNEVRTSTCFIALNYGMFGDKKEIERRLSNYLQELRDSEKAEGYDRIYTHGEKEMEARRDRLAKGILVNEATLEELKKISDALKLSMPEASKAD